VDVLSSRILLRPSDLDRSRRFYRNMLGLAIYREFGPPDDPGVVFFLGPGLLEVSGHMAGPAGHSVMIWIQVRDVHAEHARLATAGVPIVREQVADARVHPHSSRRPAGRRGVPQRLRNILGLATALIT
jgi:catechol 2,3-dioxygenase-like lactoylglutathione lyase family enzyme